MLPKLLTKRNRILRGYAAFSGGDWDTVTELLCVDVTWHTMPEAGVSRTIQGRDGNDGVLAHLKGLRNNNDVELMGVAIQGNVAVAVDFTHSTGPEGDHGCADRIRFDESGCIAEVWHCDAATHDHGHAAHPAT
jgi:ketosteroid isomerase-like protein